MLTQFFIKCIHAQCVYVFRWTKWQCDTFVICLIQVNSVPFWRASSVCGSVLQSQSITSETLLISQSVSSSYMQCKVCELCHNYCFHLLSFLDHYTCHLQLGKWRMSDMSIIFLSRYTLSHISYMYTTLEIGSLGHYQPQAIQSLWSFIPDLSKSTATETLWNLEKTSISCSNHIFNSRNTSVWPSNKTFLLWLKGSH